IQVTSSTEDTLPTETTIDTSRRELQTTNEFNGEIVITEENMSTTIPEVVITTAPVQNTVNTTIQSTSASVVKADVVVSETKVQVQKIELSTYSIKLEVGETEMPIVTMTPSNATDKSEIWNSNNVQVATVDDKGNIKGLSAGTCTITVQSKSNPNVIGEVNVTVVDPSITTSTSTVTTTATTVDTSTDNSTDNIVTTTSTSDEITEPTYIYGVLVANKTYGLPKDYDPYDGNIAPEVQSAFDKMSEDASNEGLTLYISSGFRSYDYQAQLYERYASKDGYDMADTYSARAGHSEHQTGLCFDLNTIDDSFAYTDEGIWVAENCYKYGFIVRYPKGKESITGYQYEPWHLRYLGVDLATKVYNSGLCLEEYLGITSKYSD
ncbi:MAG: D-alanyl-D-alanine carboxypeptidase family protein, partial [Oscillospiraceae bacterium]